MADEIKATRKDRTEEARKRQEKVSYNQWSEDRKKGAAQRKNHRGQASTPYIIPCANSVLPTKYNAIIIIIIIFLLHFYFMWFFEDNQ